MLEGLPRPFVFAHRGASKYAPENTLAAFRLAVEQGAQALELDAKLSRDAQIVVIHDATLDRTTGTAGKVCDTPLSALRELDAGSFFSARFQGETIPTLSEVFEEIGRRVLINVELTNYTTPNDGLVDGVVDLVKRMGMQESVLFSSFFPANLFRAKKLLPDVPCGLLTWAGIAGAWARSIPGDWIPHEALHPYLTDVTARLVEKNHRKGRRIHVWTVNQAAEMRHLVGLGVDGIFTDDPLLALQTFGVTQ